MRVAAPYLPAGLPQPVPEPDGLDAPYWAGTRRGDLLVQRCGACGGWQWGPEWICHRCLAFGMTWEPVEPRGRIFSWERAWHPVHPALRGHGPYLVVLVELPHAGGVRMVGNLLGDPLQTVEIGAAVEAVFEPHDDATPPFTLVQWRNTMSTPVLTINEPNRWRLGTPGHAGWPRTARPGDARKYFIVSADSHANEPADLWATRLDATYRHRVPRVIVDEHGVKWRVSEGHRPDRLRTDELEGEDRLRQLAGADPEQRLRDMDRDGIDAELIFPNKGLSMWATPDAAFAMAQCRVYNDWAWETFGPYNHRMSPAAAIATADLEGSIAEVQRVAKLGFRALTLPCKPVWGAHDVEHPNYNLPLFDPLWAAIQDAGLPITFHVSTGRDPRAARGNGGAVINYVSHSLSPTIEPVANLCASGVLSRFPRLRFATIEAGIGWVAWLLDAMDEAYRKHHFWVRPKLARLPSEYYREHGFASFQEDPAGLALAEPMRLVDNFMWGNDYPHHEGTWPHSAEAIERTMGSLADASRARILGLNAARLLGFEVRA